MEAREMAKEQGLRHILWCMPESLLFSCRR